VTCRCRSRVCPSASYRDLRILDQLAQSSPARKQRTTSCSAPSPVEDDRTCLLSEDDHCCPSGALRSDHVHEAAHPPLFPYREGSWWDGSHFAVPKSPLGHAITPVFLQVRNPGWFHLRAQPLVRVAAGRKRSTGEPGCPARPRSPLRPPRPSTRTGG
jgi:hypothetical protein